MARFYAEIQGSRGEASRIGDRSSGMWGYVRGWHVGAEVRMHAGAKDATLDDCATIHATDGSAGYARREIGTVQLVDGELQLQPSAWTLAQVDAYRKRERAAARTAKREQEKRAAEARKLALRKSWQFFLEHAGYATPPGRAACALELARAELAFLDAESDNRARIVWEHDSDADTSWMDEDVARDCQDMTCEYVVLQVWQDDAREWDTVASLGGIFGADDTYRRVVRAELASEVFKTDKTEGR
jgi:hypothetical protein